MMGLQLIALDPLLDLQEKIRSQSVECETKTFTYRKLMPYCQVIDSTLVNADHNFGPGFCPS